MQQPRFPAVCAVSMSVKYLPVVEEWEINDWNSGLLDCFSDAPICLCGCFFSPCLFGCNNKVLGGGNLMCCLDCLSVLFGGRNGWGTFYTAMRRKEFRRKYGLMQSSEKTKCFCGVQT